MEAALLKTWQPVCLRWVNFRLAKVGQFYIGINNYVVTIPQYASVGSLNVAVAASIAMYELMKGQSIGKIYRDEYV